MIAMPEGFCIDSTEVTRSQYETWLSTNPPTNTQPSFCSWNDDFAPESSGPTGWCDTSVWPPGSKGDHPVVCVDWCDAYAYCQAVGKRLCGKIGGGENPFDSWAEASSSQWYAACSSGGSNDYPYGDTYSSTACNDSLGEETKPVASMNDCQSSVNGYEGVFDLIGNVREWEDSCDGTTGESDNCHARGQSFSAPAYQITCGSPSTYTSYARASRSYAAGFRCCSH